MEDIDDLIKDEEEERGMANAKPSKNTVVEDMLHHDDTGDGDDAEDETDSDDAQSGAVLIGTVEHFFSKINVAAIRLTGSLKIGDVIEARGDHESVRLTVSSMQIEKEDVAEAEEGDDVGIKIGVPLSVGSRIYKIG